MNENQEPLFDAVVPVFIGLDDTKAIGVTNGYRDLETGHVHVKIEFNEAASEDLEEIFQLISTKAISFAGPTKMDEAAERAKCMANHPAGSKRVMPVKDICGDWADGHSYKICTKPRGHSGLHG